MAMKNPPKNAQQEMAKNSPRPPIRRSASRKAYERRSPKGMSTGAYPGINRYKKPKPGNGK